MSLCITRFRQQVIGLVGYFASIFTVFPFDLNRRCRSVLLLTAHVYTGLAISVVTAYLDTSTQLAICSAVLHL